MSAASPSAAPQPETATGPGTSVFPSSDACRPWTYWWWMGSAVDRTNITRELVRFRDAGFGGAHIIPIYGAKRYEDRSIAYLSEEWMNMLDHTVSEGRRLGLGVDMTTGTGWCFGGPRVTDQQANALVVSKVYELESGQSLAGTFNPDHIQALVACGPGELRVELTDRISAGGTVDWQAEGGPWKVYAISQRPSGQKVKRAAPGGAGHMLNPFYAPAMQTHLDWFTEAFDEYTGARPRAMYHDSYEYRSDWSPDLFAEFEKRRGYRLQTELPALLSDDTSDRAARVKCDYRETLSDLMIDVTLPMWQRWSRQHGFLTRNEAHGSPGNLLDLYALADIPETEMFHLDRSKLVSKFASSAAHVTGRRRVSAETGTWLKEHFTETLADMKGLVDDLFLSGVNHVIYHGSCYSPDEAGWPGWLFYASTQMNARNPIWRDVAALNRYISEVQFLLASDVPDNDILLYWPIVDFWHNPKGLAQRLTVHARDWLEEQPVGRAARRLWERGYAFDYVSDRQVLTATARERAVQVPGGDYQVIVIPNCKLIPLATFSRLLDLARAGATVLFERQLPEDVPGWADLEQRRTRLRALHSSIDLRNRPSGIREARVGSGRILVGELETLLTAAGVQREALVDHPGLMFLRKKRPATGISAPGGPWPEPPGSASPSTETVSVAGRGSSAVAQRAEADEAGTRNINRWGRGQRPRLQQGTGSGEAGHLNEPGVSAPLRTQERMEAPYERLYFIVNSGQERLEEWVPLLALTPGTEAVLLTRFLPQGPNVETARVRSPEAKSAQAYLQLEPGESVVVQGDAGVAQQRSFGMPERASGPPHPIQGEWRVEFIAGGPSLPAAQTTSTLGSWTTLPGEATEAFAGTARYSIAFDAPSESAEVLRLDLGRVVQSARVRLNGRDLGTAFVAPYRFRIEDLQPANNQLEIEVTSTAANRIRDLDRRQVEWRTFHDINFVNIDYKPFDASLWPVADAGLIGPVTLTALETYDPTSP